MIIFQSKLGLLNSKRLRLLQKQNIANNVASIDEVISGICMFISTHQTIIGFLKPLDIYLYSSFVEQKFIINTRNNPSVVGSSLQQYEPPEVGVEIYAGSAIAVIPIIWASFEFWSRIQTQQQCLVCNGSGLVKVTKSGNPLSRMRKCWSCGGFLPWYVFMYVC